MGDKDIVIRLAGHTYKPMTLKEACDKAQENEHDCFRIFREMSGLWIASYCDEPLSEGSLNASTFDIVLNEEV